MVVVCSKDITFMHIHVQFNELIQIAIASKRELLRLPYETYYKIIYMRNIIVKIIELKFKANIHNEKKGQRVRGAYFKKVCKVYSRFKILS